MSWLRAWLFATCVLWALSAEASGELADVIAKFDQQCAGASVSSDNPELIFTDGNYSHEWRVTDLKELADCKACYDTALMWRTNTASLVRFEQSSETQDWQRRVLYCFDASGRATSALLTFTSAEQWVLVAYYAVRDARFVATTTTFRNLKTWGAIPEPPNWSANRSPHGAPDPYITIGQLPFAALLRHRNRPQ